MRTHYQVWWTDGIETEQVFDSKGIKAAQKFVENNAGIGGTYYILKCEVVERIKNTDNLEEM